ncbi:MAG: HAMP domain-containing protein [Nitrospirae bacterium]|nr:HAMP domain-containing protein [Nitrospirota bacterium]
MQLKIWHKMIIGISIPALLTLIGGLWSYKYINDVKKRHSYVQIADDLKEDVLEVRRNEKNYLNYRDHEHFKQVLASITVLTRSIKMISPATIDEIGKDEFLLLNRTSTNYSTVMEKLHAHFHQEKQSIEKVREEGRRLETFAATGEHKVGLSTNFILNLRRLEKNYMLFRDRDSFTQLDNALSQLKGMVESCYDCMPYVEAIRDLFASYEKSDSGIGELQISGNTLEEITDRIARRERQHIETFFTITQRFTLIALILLCTLGPMLVYGTASYIVAPIIRLTEITKKIAEGDLSLRAPIKEHDETFTLAVSFNTMLDHLQLSHKSLEKSMELLREKQEEVEKCASVGLLVSGVAHEMNNPLNNISLTAETMKEEMDVLSHGELNECLQDILNQSDRAKRVVENLLNYVGARKSSAVERLDINSVVNESVNLITNELMVTNIHLNKNIPYTPLYVKGDHNKLEEILVNIMVNAIHALKDADPGVLSVSISHEQADGQVLISIGDNGHGIPESDLKNIFEPFFTTKPTGLGTGLGLPVARKLAREHYGEIEVESKEGEGTTFKIRLPVYEENV